MKDPYIELFDKIGLTQKRFFEIGIESIIIASHDKLVQQWNELKGNLENNNKKLFVRGYSPDKPKRDAFITLIKYLFPNGNIDIDVRNNTNPTKIIAELTSLKKDKSAGKNYEIIQNYQVSHIFGRTKNPYLFNAGWNIAYIPKYLDPFTGHETVGQINSDFKEAFNIFKTKKLKYFIDDYNSIVNNKSFQDNLTKSIAELKKNFKMPDKSFNLLSKNAMFEFSPIEIGE